MHFNFPTMRKLSIASYLMLISAIAIGQVTTNSRAGLSATYPNLNAAIQALNAAVINNLTGTVEITLTGNETAPPGGYIITAIGTTTSQIIIKSETNSLIQASASQSPGSLTDAVFKIIGGDWITISGFNIQENPLNNELNPLSNNMTEWGIAMLNASPTNGCQSNSIIDNRITMRRNYVNSFGIYANSNHNTTDVTVQTAVSSNAGRNRNFTISRNRISNVNIGISLTGAPNFPGDQVFIGGRVIQNQISPINIIDNFGSSNQISDFALVEKIVSGISIRNYSGAGNGVAILSNQLFSSSDIQSNLVRGITVSSDPNFSVGSNLSIFFEVSGNVVSVNSSNAGGTIEGIFTGTFNNNTAIEINNNNFINSGFSVSGATGDVFFVKNRARALSLKIENNAFSGLEINSIGKVFLIHNEVSSPANGLQSISGNQILGAFRRTSSGTDPLQTIMYGIFTGDTLGSHETASVTWNNNVFRNINLSGVNSFFGLYNHDGKGSINENILPSNVSKNFIGNVIDTVRGASAGSRLVGFSIAGGSFIGNPNIIRNSLIRNISIGGTITAIECLGTPNSFYDVNGNNIFNLTSSTGTVTGISNNATTANTFQNRIYNLSGTGKTVALAIGGSTHNAHRNTIFNIINTASGNAMAAGIEASMAATGNSLGAVFNNIVGDIKTPNSTSLNGAMGLNLLGGSNTRYNVYYNTILLRDTSTGATYGNSGVHFEGTLEGVDMRNTIVINKSQPGNAAANNSANGVTAAVRRTGGTAGSTANYLATSNNNLYWANPNASINNRATWVDGTASITNLVRSVANLKTALVNRDQGSFEEDAPFFSTTLEDANYLKFETNTFTLANNNALPIAGITIDIDGEARSATTPDIGADEINFILPVGLMTFSGQRIGSDNVLSWRTSFEFNNHGFEVLRSVDGRNFEKVSYVNSLAEDGNSQVQLNYTFRDQKVNNITYFYRLRQVDFDGTSKLTSIVKIDGGPIANTLRINSVFPNPARSVVNTMVEAPGADKLNITITDMNGRVISQSVNQVDRGNNTISLPVSQLGSGLYIIRFTNQAGEVTTQRFIKQ